MKAPDFFLVGSPKTGTTSLHGALRSHPEIFMPAIKEPQYLASDLLPRAAHQTAPRELGYPKTLSDYLALFSEAAPRQRVGEATPTYLYSHTAAERIADLCPDARIIAILREPASFVRSLHLTFLRDRNEAELDLRRAIELEPARRAGRDIPRISHRPQLLHYCEHVRYVDQLRRYAAHFPPEQMLLLIYDDFRADNEAIVREILRFLDVDDEAPIELPEVHVSHPWVGPPQSARSQRVRTLMNSLPTGRSRLARSARTAVDALTTPPMRRAVRRGVDQLTGHRLISTEVPRPDRAYMHELRLRFKPEVEALSDYLGRDLVSLWGYDRLD
jgi:hypothetical protein